MLPNGDRAVVDIAKLRDYCLNPHHEDGKHKARAFRSALGIGSKDAEWLRVQLLQAAAREPATRIAESQFGILYMIDCWLTTPAGSAIVRSGWIVRFSEDFPRLTTCYVKGEMKL